MSPDLERLIELQQLESAIAEARAHDRRAPAAAGRRRRAADRGHAARSRPRSSASKTTRRRGATLEKDAAVYQGRLTKFKDQLSAVKTNREYQAMQHEIETAQNDLGAVEEKVLERMMEADALAADVKQAEAALAAQQKEIDAEKKALAEELAADRSGARAGDRRRAPRSSRRSSRGWWRSSSRWPGAQGRRDLAWPLARPLLGLPRAAAAAGLPAGAAERQHHPVRQLPAHPLLRAAAAAPIDQPPGRPSSP